MSEVNWPDESEATSLAFTLAEAADDRHRGPIQDDDGVVRAPSLERNGDRLHIRGEPEVWFDLSTDGCPRTQHESGADLPHKVRHQDAPMTTFKGWHRAADGWILVSTDGTSWLPEAYVPEDRSQGRDGDE